MRYGIYQLAFITISTEVYCWVSPQNFMLYHNSMLLYHAQGIFSLPHADGEPSKYLAKYHFIG